MRTRGRLVVVSAVFGLVAAWFAGQTLLSRHAIIAMHEGELSWVRRTRLLHPDATFGPVQPVHLRFWVLPATESLLAMLACLVVAAALAAGGRRLWAALLPAAVPVTLFVGRGDATSIGLGWMQPFAHLQGWLTIGAVVDALVVVAAAALVIVALPRREATTPVAPAVLRTLPIAVAAFGYWLIGNPTPDSHARFFVTRALLLILTAAVVATLRLPLGARVLVLFVLPFADPTMSQGLIEGYGTWGTYLHHVAVGAGAAAYVLGIPALTQRLRRPRSASLAGASTG